MNKFPEKRLIKLRYKATQIRVIHGMLYLLKYLRDKPVTNLEHTLFGVPCQHHRKHPYFLYRNMQYLACAQ
jgi:hypothetical protein